MERFDLFRAEIAKTPNEFIDDGDIPDGNTTCSGLTYRSGNYECEIQDIAILPGRATQMGEPLTPDDQCALRSELANLLRIARIARPDALYDAPISGQTFAAADRAI